jgi:NAD(P)-dependent dehydrogenase (short-subunit alcohol dehydrogenase family)
MSKKIEGTIALVTGSNRGIGRALVEALLDRGATKVYATARDASRLDDLQARHGDRVVPLSLDVTDAQQVRSVAADAGDVQLLINNAGFAGDPNTYGVDELDDARREFEVNYFGTLETMRAFAPILKDNGGGSIVNISSVAGLVNFPFLPSYSDSKAALHSATQGARLLLGGQGTHVMGVYPGPVDTDMAKGIDMPKATPQSVADAILDGVEAGATAVFPDDMAKSFTGGYEAGAATLEAGVAQMMTQG